MAVASVIGASDLRAKSLHVFDAGPQCGYGAGRVPWFAEFVGGCVLESSGVTLPYVCIRCGREDRYAAAWSSHIRTRDR
jgi:hypothetical protein